MHSQRYLFPALLSSDSVLFRCGLFSTLRGLCGGHVLARHGPRKKFASMSWGLKQRLVLMCSLTNPRIFLWGRHERKGVLRQTNQAWLWCKREIQRGPQMTRKKTPSSPRTIWPPRFKWMHASTLIHFSVTYDSYRPDNSCVGNLIRCAQIDLLCHKKYS